MRIKPVVRESVITKVADELRRQIEVSGVKPGDALPSETELSIRFRISRNSVREALRILVGLGYIDKEPNKRAVVRSLPNDAVNNALDSSAFKQVASRPMNCGV